MIVRPMLVWLSLAIVSVACATVIAVLVRRQTKLVDRLRELSSRQQQEAELHRSEKLAALSRLVTGAAHELNNPLTAIMGYAELLAYDFNANEEQRSFAEKIPQQTRRMRAITANLQNFAGAPLEDKKRLLEVNTIISSAMRIEELKLGTQKIIFRQQTRRMRAITANLQNFAGAPLEDKKRLLEVNTNISSAMRIEELKLGTQKI